MFGNLARSILALGQFARNPSLRGAYLPDKEGSPTSRVEIEVAPTVDHGIEHRGAMAHPIDCKR